MKTNSRIDRFENNQLSLNLNNKSTNLSNNTSFCVCTSLHYFLRVWFIAFYNTCYVGEETFLMLVMPSLIHRISWCLHRNKHREMWCIKHEKKYCEKGWECKGWLIFRCNFNDNRLFSNISIIESYFEVKLADSSCLCFLEFSFFYNRRIVFRAIGFGTTENPLQIIEIASFLGHIDGKTFCKFCLYYF